jgi:4-hydroxybenzoate polyprenyltransferase
MGEAGLPHETIRVKSMTVRDWIKALRLHHWTKNIVLFVPLFVSQEFDERANNAALALAFLAFGLLASAGYLVNDIRDVEADRAHPRKRKRAIASGRLSVGTALAFASLLTISGLTLAAFLPGGFIYYAIGYLAISLSYTMALKRQPMTDILVIGGLFTIRLAAGAAVLHLPLSLWLASFGLMLFCSLAFAKRTGGLAAAAAGGRTVAGSPYNPEDRFLLTVFGVACALVSVLVMVLYFQFKALATGLYDDIEWLYAIPIVLFSWLMRVWIFAFRGLLHEDPVVFALKDPLSWLHAVAVLAFWVIADKPGLGPL